MPTIKKKQTRPTYFNTKRTLPLTGHRAFLITTFRNLCPFEDGSSLESWIHELFDYVHLGDKKVKKYHLNNWIKNKPWITDFKVNEPRPVRNKEGLGVVVLSEKDVFPTSSIGGGSPSTQEGPFSHSSVTNYNQTAQDLEIQQQERVPVPHQTQNSIQMARNGLVLISALVKTCKTMDIPGYKIQLSPLVRTFQHLIKNPPYSGGDQPETSNFDEVVLNNIKQQ